MIVGQIIDEADIIVPNEVPIPNKLAYINSLNFDFFNVVKIPRVVLFQPIKDQREYILPDDIRLKNIDILSVGVIKYKELVPDIGNPLQNTFTFDDSTHALKLSPAPYQTGLQGLIRYNRIATTIFNTGNIYALEPDPPTEYHYSFVLGLASYIASTQDDAIKASNYENQYKAMWNVAAQNYAKEVTV